MPQIQAAVTCHRYRELLHATDIGSCYMPQIQAVKIMVFNATFNNIGAISWRSVLLVEETGVPGENYRPAVLM
jgi:hypothetical protein